MIESPRYEIAMVPLLRRYATSWGPAFGTGQPQPLHGRNLLAASGPSFGVIGMRQHLDQFFLMKHYELLALVSGSLSDEELAAAQEQIRGIVEKHGGRLTKQGVWEKRKLAYPIQHIKQGAYLLFLFDGEPATLVELNRTLTHERLVLRHHIVIAHQKTAKELEEETKREFRRTRIEREPAEAAPPAPPITQQELDEKLAEILKDDMVK